MPRCLAPALPQHCLPGLRVPAAVRPRVPAEAPLSTRGYWGEAPGLAGQWRRRCMQARWAAQPPSPRPARHTLPQARTAGRQGLAQGRRLRDRPPSAPRCRPAAPREARPCGRVTAAAWRALPWPLSPKLGLAETLDRAPPRMPAARLRRQACGSRQLCSWLRLCWMPRRARRARRAAPLRRAPALLRADNQVLGESPSV